MNEPYVYPSNTLTFYANIRVGRTQMAAATVLAKRLSERAAEVDDHKVRLVYTKFWDDEDRRLE
jgi:hypothetical protein